MSRLLLLAFAFFAIAAAPAAAHSDPPGCVNSDLQLAVTANKTSVRPGAAMTFTVKASNNSAGACHITDATVTLRLPSATGTATGELKTLTTTGSFAAGSTGTVVGAAVPYTVAVNAGVTALAVRADATFKAHTGAPDEADTAKGSAAVTVTQPSLTLTAIPSPATGLAPLSSTVVYLLTNTSSTTVPVTNLTIADGGCSTITHAGGDSDADNVLDNGEGWLYTCQVRVDRPGEMRATVVASGVNSIDLQPISPPNASWTITATAPPRPHITLTKSADPLSGIAPFATTYTYTVVNDSEPNAKPVTNVSIDDAGCSPAIAVTPDDSLARGEQLVFTCAYALTSAISITSTAVATAQDSYDSATISSNSVSTTVSASLPANVVPAPESTATPTPTPTAPGLAPDGTPIPTAPANKPSTRVKFAYTGRFSPARSCRGTVTLTLTAGKKKVAVKKVRLDSKCRFKISFDVARSRLAKATKVTVTAKAAGKRTASKRLTVPKR